MKDDLEDMKRQVRQLNRHILSLETKKETLQEDIDHAYDMVYDLQDKIEAGEENVLSDNT